MFNSGIRQYVDEDCYVAFMDISGFKAMMEKDDHALKALDRFYQIGYDCLCKDSEDKNGVDGVFISDSCILISSVEDSTKVNALEALLKIIKEINCRMIENDYALTTSVAYGRFTYFNKFTHENISKEPIYGKGYLKAYYDNEYGKPKLEQGQCRLLNDEEGITDDIVQNLHSERTGFVIVKQSKAHGYLFHWYLNNASVIKKFKREFDSCSEVVYEKQREVIREYLKR